MLFNSYEFLFVYLPATLFGFFIVGRFAMRPAAALLALASFIFYAWWDVRFVLLLGASITLNYAIGLAIGRANARKERRLASAATFLGVATNIAVLGYFKYAGFLVSNINIALGTDYPVPSIVLPLGISFFTFTQIAFLIDTYRGIAREYNPIHYALFVTYFPHLIAGPILHHKEMMPQFESPPTYAPHAEHFAVGLTIFTLGLAKKVMLADGIAPFASDMFSAAARGETPTLFIAWGGVVAYALQLYFDFSGYSDMAIGLSRLFGVRLPLNFDSPYKAASIIEFWRRWHMTLSRFLRDYLYVPLGGSRHGRVRRYANLMVVMLLGGLWHGAGWTFVIWGALHGIYLIANHAWRAFCESFHWKPNGALYHAVSVTLTFLAVLFAWTFFRAADLGTALRVVDGMLGGNGVTLPAGLRSVIGPLGPFLEVHSVSFTLGGGTQFVKMVAWIAALLPIVFFVPNTQQIMGRFEPALERVLPARPNVFQWQPDRTWAIVVGSIAAFGILALTQHSEFLYFQF
jgi:D-alanyl-lipoteichoic acid acyltransferase DltB (MBOAT superfamily)